jgi:hypothetical protein
MRLFSRVIIGMLSVLLSLSAHSNLQSWQNVNFISQSFYEVALGSEYALGNYQVRKWVKPIKIFVQHDVGDAELQNQLINAHLNHLTNITGLNIQRVNKIQKANIKFFFTNQKNLKNLSDKHSGRAVARVNTQKTCIANIKLNNRSEVSSAQIYIPVDFAYRSGSLVGCIVEELTQVLGLPRDSEKVYPSIFNDKSTNQLLTGLDETLIRILYNPKIKAGMSKKSLSRILTPIINQLSTKGYIASANSRVRKTKLYAMLGY